MPSDNGGGGAMSEKPELLKQMIDIASCEDDKIKKLFTHAVAHEHHPRGIIVNTREYMNCLQLYAMYHHHTVDVASITLYPSSNRVILKLSSNLREGDKDKSVSVRKIQGFFFELYNIIIDMIGKGEE